MKRIEMNIRPDWDRNLVIPLNVPFKSKDFFDCMTEIIDIGLLPTLPHDLWNHRGERNNIYQSVIVFGNKLTQL